MNLPASMQSKLQENPFPRKICFYVYYSYQLIENSIKLLEDQHRMSLEHLTMLKEQKLLALKFPEEYLEFLQTGKNLADDRKEIILEDTIELEKALENPLTGTSHTEDQDLKFQVCPTLQPIYSLPEIDFYKYRSQFSVNRRGELSIQEEKAMELCIQKLLALQRSNIGHFKVAL